MSTVAWLSGFGAVLVACGAGWALWGIYSLPVKSRQLRSQVAVGFIHVSAGCAAIIFPAKLESLHEQYDQTLGLVTANELLGDKLMPYSLMCVGVVFAGLVLAASHRLGWHDVRVRERLSGIVIVGVGIHMHLYSSLWWPVGASVVYGLMICVGALATIVCWLALWDLLTEHEVAS